MTANLILASKSETRQKILRDFGVAFEVAVAKVDEGTIKKEQQKKGLTPEEIANYLAKEKAIKISKEKPESYVLGADQILEINGEIFSKAATPARAKEQLKKLSGKTHSLISAAAMVCKGDVVWQKTDKAHITIKDLSDEEIDAYIKKEKERVLHSVGCYQIENNPWLLKEAHGDFFTILGLPIYSILKELQERNKAGLSAL